MSTLKKKVEAVLFLTGRAMPIDEICRLCNAQQSEIQQALQELRAEYEQKNSSLALVCDADLWKFTVGSEYMSMARKIVSDTELTKSVLETLAVIAFKYPILQADLIKLRTNKAYAHLDELEELGFIVRQKKGRTNLIKLTDKFFRYFDLPPEKLKDRFKDFVGLAMDIEQKEETIEKNIQFKKQTQQELAQQDEKIKKEIEALDKQGEEYQIPLDVYPVEQKKEPAAGAQEGTAKEMLGNLEIVDENPASPEKVPDVPVEQNISENSSKTDIPLEDALSLPENGTADNPDEKKEGLPLPKPDAPEVQKEIDKMLHPPKENSEDT